jgi:hypothetical protein
MKHRWLVRARFWKLILSQNTEGYWDASSTVAFALEAREASETVNLPPSLLTRLKDAVGGATEAINDDRDIAEAVLQGWQGDAAAAPEDEPVVVAAAETVDLDSYNDCPLTCSVSAITASLPPRMAAVLAADAGAEVMRVWSTMLAISMLERLNVSWLWGDGCACSGCRVAPHARAALVRQTAADSARGTGLPASCTRSRSARLSTERASGWSATRRSTQRSPRRWRTARCRSAPAA